MYYQKVCNYFDVRCLLYTATQLWCFYYNTTTPPGTTKTYYVKGLLWSSCGTRKLISIFPPFWKHICSARKNHILAVKFKLYESVAVEKGRQASFLFGRTLPFPGGLDVWCLLPYSRNVTWARLTHRRDNFFRGQAFTSNVYLIKYSIINPYSTNIPPNKTDWGIVQNRVAMGGRGYGGIQPKKACLRDTIFFSML